MAEILRSWHCQGCDAHFDSWDAGPACPECGNVRVDWQPAGGHIGGKTNYDKVMRDLCDAYGMTDMNTSLREGDRAMPAVRQAPPAPGPLMHFAPGFAAVPFDRNGQGVCMPSAEKVNFKTTVGVGTPLAPSGRFGPGIASKTQIIGRVRE